MAGHIYNELIITFTDNNETGVTYEADITAENIVEESMKLVQSINDENYLKFGGCIASEFSIDLLNTDDRQFTQSLVGRWISVKLIQHTISNRPIYPSDSLYPSDTLCPGYEPDETTYYIFSGFIQSAKLSQDDTNVRTIVAYDALALLYEADATNEVYDRIKTYTNVFDCSVLFGLMDSFPNHLGICFKSSYNGKIDLPLYTGDDWYSRLYREYALFDKDGDGNFTEYSNIYSCKNEDWNTSDSQISYGQLLKNACELVAAFGVIIPDSGKGSFKAITLAGTPKVYSYYEKLQMEEYESTGYTDFRFLIHSGSTSKNGKSADGKSSTLGGIWCSDAVEKTYDFTQNILIWEEYAVSGNSRTATSFDRFINVGSSGGNEGRISMVGARLAMKSEVVREERRGSVIVEHTYYPCAFDSYRPLKATVEGTPEQLVGKPITIIANKTNPDGSYVEENGEYVKERINTYVFKRTLSGIQALTDEIEVKGQR